MSDAPKPWVIRENVISVTSAYGDPDITPLDWAEKAQEVLMQVRNADLARPRVKPLEWEGGNKKALSVVGEYEIVKLSGALGGGCFFVTHNGSAISADAYNTHKEAKAAAQADFERRIMECLL